MSCYSGPRQLFKLHRNREPSWQVLTVPEEAISVSHLAMFSSWCQQCLSNFWYSFSMPVWLLLLLLCTIRGASTRICEARWRTRMENWFNWETTRSAVTPRDRGLKLTVSPRKPSTCVTKCFQVPLSFPVTNTVLMQNLVNKPCHFQPQPACIHTFPIITYTVIPAFFHDLVSIPGCQIKPPRLQSRWFVSPAWRDPSESGEVHVTAMRLFCLIACLPPQPPALLILRLSSTISKFLSSFQTSSQRRSSIVAEVSLFRGSLQHQLTHPNPQGTHRHSEDVSLNHTRPSIWTELQQKISTSSLCKCMMQQQARPVWFVSLYSWALSEPFTSFLSL